MDQDYTSFYPSLPVIIVFVALYIALAVGTASSPARSASMSCCG